MSDIVDPSSRARRRHGAIRSDEVRDVDPDALERDLRAALRGEVCFGPGDRAMHGMDASNFRQIPLGVVRPLDKADVLAALEVCRRHDAPVLARGAGTSQAGQAVNTAVVFDFTKHMHHVLWIDPERRLARVQPGVICDQLRAEAERFDLWWGPDPATHTHCTFGGMIANNACGVHALMAGRTAENVHSLEIATWDGAVMEVGALDDEAYAAAVARGGREAEILRALRDLRDAHGDLVRERYPRIPRRVSGYNLDELLPEKGFHVARSLVGTEGTCALFLEATVHLVPFPRHVHVVVVGYPDVYEAADDVVEVLETHPIGLEGVDRQLVDDMIAREVHLDGVPLLPEGDGWLLARYAGRTDEEARSNAEALVSLMRSRGRAASTWRVYTGERAETVWQVRESGQWATARHPKRGDAWPGWEDAAVAPDRLPEYLRAFRALLAEFGYTAALFGHFGQGCVHCNIDFDLKTAPGIEKYRRFVQRAADLVISLGGSLSGEHGDGQARGELLDRMFGADMVDVMRRFKAIWDPHDRMNPGKVVDAAPLDANLRLGAGYEAQVWEPETVFRWPDDQGRFSLATQRCIGVGKCRRDEGGIMCPSWRATREERHTTRGRAHLLWEMLQSDSPVRDRWASEEVRSALELCLSCKGCKAECPMQVDVASYRAEFYHHHYARKLRPRVHHVFGRVMVWARWISKAPWLANGLLRVPLLSGALRRAVGFHPDRPVPPFAPETFRAWFGWRRARRADARPKVCLWADTWTNHLWPEVGMSAVEVLEAAGWEVVVIQRDLCCGRPLFEYGFLKDARRELARVLDALEDAWRVRMPVVVLEPSCASVFVDEIVNLFPDDPRARWLRDATTPLDAFLATYGHPDGRPLDGVTAAVHAHCHHAALFAPAQEHRVLRRLGARVEPIHGGCCGMAGGFGFEAATYETSVAVGRAAFLPEVERHAPETVLVTDGYSCRKQAKDLAFRDAFHLAEVTAQALAREPVSPDTLREAARRRRRTLRGLRLWRRLPLLLAAIGAVAAVLTRRARR